MAAVTSLSSVALVELDKNGDVIWVWKYPSLNRSQESFLERKCPFDANDDSKICSPLFGKIGKHWFYFSSSLITENTKLPKVLRASVVIIAKDFNPERYNAIGQILVNGYLNTGTPVTILELYLGIFTIGKCQTEEGAAFTIENYTMQRALTKTCFKEIIALFGIEVIIIYTALLLKRRVVVLANKLDVLLNVCRTLPALIWHRKDWNILYPYVHLQEGELEELKLKKTYVAGCLDQAVESRTDLYDVLVNVSEGEISVNPEAKAYFQMGKLHKDIAMSLIEKGANEDITEQEILEALHKRSIDILTNLKSLGTRQSDDEQPYVTLKRLQSCNLSPVMQTFLYNLALAEGLLRRQASE